MAVELQHRTPNLDIVPTPDHIKPCLRLLDIIANTGPAGAGFVSIFGRRANYTSIRDPKDKLGIRVNGETVESYDSVHPTLEIGRYESGGLKIVTFRVFQSDLNKTLPDLYHSRGFGRDGDRMEYSPKVDFNSDYGRMLVGLHNALLVAANGPVALPDQK